MPGSPAHLFRRFFDVLFARPLTRSERAEVEGWLPADLAEPFFDQPDADQRHGYQAASIVLASGWDDGDVVAAALLHDVGKRHSRLGVVGRSLTSVFVLAKLPLNERMAAYRDHGLLGAQELGGLGAPALAIDFAIHHHGPRPPSIDPGTWRVLVEADEPPKTWPMILARIISRTT